MRFFLDTEFYEDGKTIDLISIGIVAEDGRSFYAESSDFDWNRVPEKHWIQENVKPNLQYHLDDYHSVPGLFTVGGFWDRDRIGYEIAHFVGANPEFWAYFADYDWVALCQLYGTMMQLPSTWPMFCLDIKQWAHHLGVKSLPKQATVQHNALSDANHNYTMWAYLNDYQRKINKENRHGI